MNAPLRRLMAATLASAGVVAATATAAYAQNFFSQLKVESLVGQAIDLYHKGDFAGSLDRLDSAIALSPTDVWVAGYNRTPRQEGRITLVQHWNGKQWSTVPNPNPTQPNYFDLSMAAVSSTNVWVVGQYYNAADSLLPLTERWNGTSWKIVATPALPSVTDESRSLAPASAAESDTF